MKKRYLSGLLIAVPLVMANGCGPDQNTAPTIQSDGDLHYDSEVTIPTDENVYVLKGTVASDVHSITRQTSPGGGTINSATCYGTSGCYGGGGGTVFGPTLEGKGYVRLLVATVSPTTDLATPGNISILKTTDTKAAALLPGDNVVFKCRRQYEAVGPAVDNETVDNKKKDTIATWELDLCRMVSPLVDVPAK